MKRFLNWLFNLFTRNPVAWEKETRIEWAEREIDLACEQIKKTHHDKIWVTHDIRCYQMALRVFKIIAGKNTGASVPVVQGMLNQLIYGKPFTPIYDTDDIWYRGEERTNNKGKYEAYQCKRMTSLFKDVYEDGTIEYTDVESYYGVEISNPNCTFHGGVINRIAREMFPIKMPYYPEKPVAIYCDECLFDRKNGDFDTVAVLYAVKDGKQIPINRYFKDAAIGYDEIDEAEYKERKRAANFVSDVIQCVAEKKNSDEKKDFPTSCIPESIANFIAEDIKKDPEKYMSEVQNMSESEKTFVKKVLDEQKEADINGTSNS
jgi:hypothetical protein